MLAQRDERGFTLVEVIMVVIIMGIITAVAMRSLTSSVETARIEETRNEMNQLAEAIAGNAMLYNNGVRTSFGYVGDVGSLPANLDALVTSPGYATWRGPYVRADFSNFSDDYKRDAWGQLYAYTGSVMIRSVGSADSLTRVIASAASDLTNNSVTGIVTDAGGNPPGDSAIRVNVVLRYPNGSGGYKDSILTPNASGVFTFNNCVPIGNHTIKAVYSTTADTIQSFVSVPPKSTVNSQLRFPGSLWAAGGGGGGGGGTATITYVAGSAAAFGTGSASVRFDINNTGTASASITSISLTYSPTAYYRYVYWNGTVVFNSSNPRSGSGTVSTFTSTQSISAGQTLTVRVEDFRTGVTGGSRVNMRGTAFTVLFSNGATISFTTP